MERMDAAAGVDEGWQALLTSQHGLASTAQARAHGFSDGVLRCQLSARRWQRVHRGVLATFTGPLTRPARLYAALLYAGWPAALSHHSAAEEWGLLRPADDEPVHVTVPYRCSASSTDAVAVHRSRAFELITVEGYPPRVGRAETVLDVAAGAPTPAEATSAVVALGGARVPLRQLQAALRLRRPWRHRRAIEDGVRLLADGVMSVLEHRYLTDVELRHGLPTATRQVPVVVDGRTLWEDCDYHKHGLALVVRLDGRAVHSVPEIAFRDRRRDNAAELSGNARLVYGWQEVDGDPCGVALEVAQVLRREGWTGELHACHRRCTS